MPLVNDIDAKPDRQPASETPVAAVELCSLVSHITPLSQEEFASFRAGLRELIAADEEDEALLAWEKAAFDDWPDYDWANEGPPRP